MTLKRALIASAVWTVLGFVACVAVIAVIAGRGGRAAEQRAAQAGSGAGLVMVVGYAGIWLPYAAAVGKQRRAATATGKSKVKRRRDD